MSDDEYAQLRDLLVYVCAKTTELEARVLDTWALCAARDTPLHRADPTTAAQILRISRDDLIEVRLRFLEEQFPAFAGLFRQYVSFADADQTALKQKLREAAGVLQRRADSAPPADTPPADGPTET